MNVTSLTQEVSALEQRRKALTSQLTEVDARLERVRAILGAESPARSEVLRSTTTAAGRSDSLNGGKANGAARRSWFERGEALALSKKVLSKPMRPAELVRALADAKGLAEKLPKADFNRFQVAAYAAIKHAVDAKKLNKAKDGSISARR